MTKSKRETTSRFDQTATPIEPSEFSRLGDRIREVLEANLDRGLPAGFAEQGLEGINRSFAGGQTAIDNALTARGLGTSPVGGNASANLEIARAGSSGSFLASLPAQERELRDRALAQAIGFFATRPLGQRVSGTGESTTVSSPSILSSILSVASLGAGIATPFFGGRSGGAGAKQGPFFDAPPPPGPVDFGFNNLNPPAPSFFTPDQLFKRPSQFNLFGR